MSRREQRFYVFPRDGFLQQCPVRATGSDQRMHPVLRGVERLQLLQHRIRMSVDLHLLPLGAHDTCAIDEER